MFTGRHTFERQILIALSAMLVAALAIGVASFIAFSELKESADALIVNNEQTAIRAEKFRNAFEREAGVSRTFLLTGRNDLIVEMRNAETRSSELASQLESSSGPDSDLPLLREIGALDHVYNDTLLKALDSKKTGTPIRTISGRYARQLDETSERLYQLLTQYVHLQEEHLDRARADAKHTFSRVTKLVIAIGLGVLVLAAAISFLFGRTVVRLYREAKLSAQARDELISAVSHELKTPITAARLSADLILRQTGDGKASPNVARSFEQIRHSLDFASHLIGDLLDLKKSEAGHLTLDNQPASANALVEEALRLVRPQAKAKNVGIKSHVTNDLVVICDRQKIVQVLLNIVGNAIKFTPEGGEVSLVAEPFLGKVRFCVTDTGPGIPSAMLPKVFDPFWQDPKTARLGTGLGLAIAKRFIEAHGETIFAKSEPGRGSMFAFSLALASNQNVHAST